MQTTSEILRQVRRLEIKTRGLTNHIFAGEYHSAFKGRGMSFSEVREYTPGDDVKTIDWNVTARFSHPFVKIFEEERELIVMLLIDVSNSSLFGTRRKLKREIITEISAVLAFSAITNNDKVGVIFFSDRVEKFIPPKKGRSHILGIIREMVTGNEVTSTSTRVGVALEYLNKVIKKRTISFLLSDFISEPFEKPLRLASRKHDLIAIRIYDEADKHLPQMGLVQTIDAETLNRIWLDTDDSRVSNQYTSLYLQQEAACKSAFQKSSAFLLTIRTDEDYVKTLQVFFKGR